ncbi:histone acetylation protein-domain-containing protein [Suillus clintonianus]|uniref:histone acetylation protein-domain-containing protein n=1 Tax=Suillus clintonianus TaxID=1904413 RepID=UPI001B87D41C|nr:histone acetylation protein-domain-containing protein [Suillus clintonianus]KAG2151372.1 histone acetylation protein-domain-containing protein [Suillus clintonianus]
MALRDALLAGLSSLPGTREFHLHVLVSSPRKHGNLFPFGNPRPRSYLQDILILLSEQTTPDSPCVFVSAIEACVYNIPTTSCAILYVSKVDSTGQATAPSPTPALVRALLLFYADPATRPISADHLWIHVFARAQNQYLFPNSSEYPRKHPLSDIKLCAWWKRQFSTVISLLASRAGDTCRTKLYYTLPGLSEFEASHSLERVYPSTGSPCNWTYGHPYSQNEIPLPCPSVGDSRHLGQCIPSFDDDPKSRFIDEIAYTTDADGIKSPERKRARADTLNTREEEPADASEKKEGRSKKEDQTHKEVKKVSVEEFWERMSFRQECIAGAVTGFFVIGVSATAPSSTSLAMSEVSPLAPQAGQVSAQMNKRVLTSLLTAHEFPSVEKAVWSTKVIEDSIRGLCDGLKSSPILVGERSGRQTPEPEPRRSTLAPPQTPPPRLGKRAMVDISPNPFPEPVASLETYNSYIFGSIMVKNPPPPEKDGGEVGGAGDGRGPIITVLTARKKRTKG